MKEIILVDSRETENTKLLEEVVSIFIHPDYLDRYVMIRTKLAEELQSAMVKF